ncbi:DNA adenine methylase [Mesorhizobium sp. Cs1321R2N1]|uniref:DNA adenine methylase n=1 Tax=Mesorhizobium sp. Cs1321R2N1 TaxID=3015174 RepID=UPI00301BDA5B
MAYVGGKGNCFTRVIGAMPRHTVYIETHLGGGAVMRAKRPAPRQIGIDADERVIACWRERGAPCELVHGDAIAFLKQFQFTGGELVYADPPYPAEVRSGSYRYRHDYREEDHAELLELLASLSCHVLISGQPSRLYNEKLIAWRCMEFGSGGRRGGRRELLWANFSEPLTLHEPAKAGATFRDRERSKRRLSTIQRKVERMGAAERTLFVEWLAATYPGHVKRLENEIA